MNVSIDKHAAMGVRWVPRQLLKRLAAAITMCTPRGMSPSRSVELDDVDELCYLTEDAYGEDLPSAPAYPAPDLWFLKSASTQAPAGRRLHATMAQLRQPRHRPAGFSLPAASRLRATCSSSLKHLAAMLATAQARTRLARVACEAHVSFAGASLAIRLDAGIRYAPYQAIYWRGSGRPLSDSGAF